MMVRGVPVSLTASQLRQAAMVGVERQIDNLFHGRQHAYGMDPEMAWQAHIEGAAGEMAVAKWSGRYWCGNFGELDADDVGDWQVRTAAKHHYQLILHKKDRPERAFLLVTGLAPHYQLRGWIEGREGQQPDLWRDPKGGRPAYFIPQPKLRALPVHWAAPTYRAATEAAA